jgi:hypothetical protein
MAKTIPQLTDATTVNAADELIIQQGGITKRATAAELMNNAPVTATSTTTARPLADRFTDMVNVKDFGAVGDGVADDTAALQSAITASAGKTLVLSGTFKVTNTLNITSSNTRLVGSGLAKIVASGSSWTSGQPVLQIAGAGAGTTTTLTSAITSSSTTFSVASAAGLSAGMFVTISSGSEYWSGITGNSGFQPVNKSELNCIRSVSGTTITPEWGFEDTYSISGHTVTVTPYTFIQNVMVRGVQFYGLGNGNANTLSGVNPLAIKASFVNNLSIEGCRIENFQYSAADIVLCNSVRVCNNDIIGRDLTDSTNGPTVSAWFYGVTFLGSCNWVFSNNTCQYLRRAVDANFTSGTTIARHGTVSSNTAISCQNGYGSHFCEDIVFSGNVATDCESGIFFRGKNATIVGNTLEAVGSLGYGILFGNNQAGAYTENPSSGFVTISGNTIVTASRGIAFHVDVEGGAISNNVVRGGSSTGVWFIGKRAKDLIVSNNHIDITNRASAVDCIWFDNTTSPSDTEVLKNVLISGNRLKNATTGIRVEGPSSQANAASNIVIKDNLFADDLAGMVRGVALTVGHFDKNIIVRDNVFEASVTSSPVFIDSAAHLFSQAPDNADNAFWDYNQQVIKFSTNTTLQSKLTAVAGQRIINSAPAPSGYMGWVCTTSGTAGTLTGITGDITSGSPTLIVSSNSNNIFVGCFVTVAGAGAAAANLSAQVTAVSGTTITLNTNAGTTVTGAAVTYTAPVFKGFGAIQA